SPARTRALVRSALSFLDETQVRKTEGTARFEGEWPTIIHTERDLRWMGVGPKGLKAYDSTVFTAASVHNILAEMYLADPEYAGVSGMLHRAARNFPYYEDGGTYNFYPVIPTVKDGK